MWHWPEEVRISAVVPIVAQYEDTTGWHSAFLPTVPNWLNHIRFLKSHVVDVDLAIADGDSLPWQPDHPPDRHPVSGGRCAHDDNLAALRRSEKVGKPIDLDDLTGGKARLHTPVVQPVETYGYTSSDEDTDKE